MATTRYNCAERWRPLRGAALLLALASAAAQSAPLVLRPAGGAQQTAVDIPVEAVGDSRLQIQFDSTLALRAIRLQPPAAPALSWTPAQALSLPRQQRQRPELGDAYVLPAQHNPAPGIWRLTVDHAKAGTGDTVTLLARQLPRFELLLNTPGRPLAEGGVGLIGLRVLDHGRSRDDVRPVLTIQPPGQAPAQTLAMTPDLRNSRGQRIGQDPGQFFAEFQPRQAGEHQLSVALSLTDSQQRPVPLKAGHALQVSPAPHARDLRPSLNLQTGPGGCLQSAEFGLDWQAGEPGLWLLSLRLAGAASEAVELNSHVDAKTAGAIRFKAMLEPRQLRRLQHREHTEADLQLVLAAAGRSEIVFRQRGLRLPKALPAGSICD
ncbi:hypothetical protein [Roseateles toxinivorans]|uniref:Uncharacterized protein n=1 Tax=Roseateles toxinivorans TaxID=270368 RepID=A0A4R6QU23_9BURK|nr:hypothetical protein [Roseateles toxinivorans]TDP74262.1 hypothetical protein DES47_101319 [Roseateles toxinivorans]